MASNPDILAPGFGSGAAPGGGRGVSPRMRRRLLAAALLLAGLATTVAWSASGRAVVRAERNEALAEPVLVSAAGLTLYHLVLEKKGIVDCLGSCRRRWSPLLVVGRAAPTAGAGVVQSRLGTIKRSDGGIQVTYNGFALYLYAGDTRAGQANGQGVAGEWYALRPDGTITKSRPLTSTGATSPASPQPATTTSETTPAVTTASATTTSATTTVGNQPVCAGFMCPG